MKKTKICPYCGEEIMASAIKCRYCGEWLIDRSELANKEERPKQTGNSPAEGTQAPTNSNKTREEANSTHHEVNNSQEAQEKVEQGVPVSDESLFPLSDPVPTSFLDAVERCFRKWNIFEGRATRKEFWFYYLFFMLSSIVVSMVIGLIFGVKLFSSNGLGIQDMKASIISSFIIMFAYTLAVSIPAISVGTRRLHDISKSGWYWFVSLIPFIGSFILLYYWIKDSDFDNEYGTNPMEKAAEEEQWTVATSQDKAISTILIIAIILLAVLCYKISIPGDINETPETEISEILGNDDTEYNDSDETELESSGQRIFKPGHYEGDINGYAISMDLAINDGNAIDGTYKNLVYGTEMTLNGQVEDNTIFLSGKADGTTYNFFLHTTDGESEDKLIGELSTPDGTTKNVKLHWTSD